MANYTRTQNFTVKDSLDTGDAEKIISGTDVDGELNAIATAIASKAEASFESGVKMVFVGASAPSGWSLVTTYDDKVLIIQNAAGESTAGNWSVSGTELAAATTGNVPNHSHSTANHTHNIAGHNHNDTIAAGNMTGSTFDGGGVDGVSMTNANAASTFFATGNASQVNGNTPLSFNLTGSVATSSTLTTGNPSATGTGNPNGTVAIPMATALSGTMVNGNYRPAYVNSFICSKN
jgi:hypothetical protein